MKINRLNYIQISTLCLVFFSCSPRPRHEAKSVDTIIFPPELVEFTPYEHNPIFTGTGTETWDRHIRERGFILAEEGIYKLWYTGYSGGDNDPKSLGYATSKDGINWTRYPQNPIFNEKWTEDIFVIKDNSIYYMFAEGAKDIAHLLTSSDGINWQEKGDLIILSSKGDTIPGPYGTPSVLIENGKWYLFYERNDEAIWLASSTNHRTWTNVSDEPVLKPGPETYDSGAIASNQVISYKGKYYMYYHGSSNTDWDKPGVISIWTSNVAMSTDLLHWIKYPKNPIVEGDHSSPILVPEGNKFRLYTMHDKAWLYLPKK